MTFAEWRERARALLAQGVRPEDAHWDAGLFAGADRSIEADIRIPRALGELLQAVACHADPSRWALMYRALWRVVAGGERDLLADAADADVARLRALAKAVDREVHHMHAFVRFHEAAGDDGKPVYRAWFEPEHDILHRAAPFFRDRFAGMRWVIATPRGAAAWDGATLAFHDEAMARPPAGDDGAEALWRTYYAHVFNPARLNPDLMRQHMPARYWKNLPEAAEFTRLSRPKEVLAPAQETAPRWASRVAVPVEEAQDLDACRRCPLWERATQGVPGEGPAQARIMLVGEQPGDEEDLHGRPFVGPAGRVLDRALKASGIPREQVYVTNAVKHFKWEPRGKRRLHKTPAQQEIEACHAWLERELAAVKPAVIVALGATAALSVLGRKVPIAASRGSAFPHASGAQVFVTYHPSAVLRAEDRADEVRRALEEDLAAAWRLVSALAKG